MTYDVTDLAELIRHHLVFAAPDDRRASQNLRQLVAEVEQMSPEPLTQSAEWLFCDRCGCSVDLAVLAWDGSNFTPDGGFYCSDCLPESEVD